MPPNGCLAFDLQIKIEEEIENLLGDRRKGY